MKQMCRNFWVDESGAVTVDWVVLTAVVAGLATVAYIAINGGTGGVADSLGTYLANFSVSPIN